MNILLKLSALALVASLAACQTTAPNRIPEPVDPAPPAVRNQSAPATASAAAATSSQSQSGRVITLHMAQEKSEASLVAIDIGGKPLYALPQPVLTQSDMQRVAPVTTRDQRTFILLEMNQNGIAKLRSITQQAKGHYLLLSVQGQLVSMAQIGDVIADGRLLVGTQNAQHTQAIIKLMQGG